MCRRRRRRRSRMIEIKEGAAISKLDLDVRDVRSVGLGISIFGLLYHSETGGTTTLWKPTIQFSFQTIHFKKVAMKERRMKYTHLKAGRDSLVQ